MTSIADSFNKEFEAFVSVVTCHAPEKEDEELDIKEITQNNNPHVPTGIPGAKNPETVGVDTKNEGKKDSEECQPTMQEKETVQAAATEENLMEFEPADLVDLSDVPPPPEP